MHMQTCSTVHPLLIFQKSINARNTVYCSIRIGCRIANLMPLILMSFGKTEIKQIHQGGSSYPSRGRISAYSNVRRKDCSNDVSYEDLKRRLSSHICSSSFFTSYPAAECLIPYDDLTLKEALQMIF